METITSDTATFNVKAVVKETGVKPDTLRAWERRYGLPQPQRSRGRHRLYSQHDIDTVKWLVARQNEGLSISRAVDLWRSIEEEGRDPLEAISLPPASTGLPPQAIVGGDALTALRDAWLSACMQFDEFAADSILSQAFAVFPAETVCLDIIRWGLAKIGDDWHAGAASVQQEHFTSAVATRRLESLIAASPLPTRQGRILVACPPDEAHTFGPLLLTWLLRRQGWHTIYLGANVPQERFVATLEQTLPHLVILAAQQLHTAATLKEMADAFYDLEIPVAYGGLIFTLNSDLTHHISGHYLGDALAEAPGKVEQLLNNPTLAPPGAPVTDAYQEALAQFSEFQPHIRAQVRDALSADVKAAIPNGYLNAINTHMAQHIEAALRLGDLDFLGTDLRWVAGLLEHRNIPVYALHGYIKTYHEAAESYLDARSEPILSWLRDMANVVGF